MAVNFSWQNMVTDYNSAQLTEKSDGVCNLLKVLCVALKIVQLTVAEIA